MNRSEHAESATRAPRANPLECALLCLGLALLAACQNALDEDMDPEDSAEAVLAGDRAEFLEAGPGGDWYRLSPETLATDAPPRRS